jgi:hypothetical protein
LFPELAAFLELNVFQLKRYGEERNCFHALGRWRQPLAVEEKYGMFQAQSTYTYLAKCKFVQHEKGPEKQKSQVARISRIRELSTE